MCHYATWLATAGLFLTALACSSGSHGSDGGSGGQTGSGGATDANGAAVGSDGQTGSGGATDANGAAVGSGGQTGSGGATGANGGAVGSGGQTGSGGATGANGGAVGSGGATVEGCKGLSLQQSGVLDLELHAITVSGAVTLNGAALPTASSSRGTLLFSADSGRSTASVDLGSSGAKTYALRLPPGTYDISYAPSAALCASAASNPPMPCSGGSLRRGLALATDGVLDIDVPAIEVSGNVTLKGAALPSQSTSRGSVAFVGTGGGQAATVALGSSSAATYRELLLPGTYDVTFNGNPAACAGASAPELPCNGGTLKQRLSLSSTGVLDLDIPVVHVTGTATLAGAPLPAESSARGSLSFVAAGGAASGSASTASFGTSGAANYALSLIPGKYDVVFVASPTLCGVTPTPKVPCIGGKVLTGSQISTDGVLDVDLKAVTVSGAVTVGGAAMPDATKDRGKLAFSNSAGGTGSTAVFGTAGAALYTLRVLTSSYDVTYVANPQLCASADKTSPLPCTGGRLKSGLNLASDGVLDIDLPMVAVSGAVTVQGAAMPEASANRGALVFALRDGTTLTTPQFGNSGSVTYAVSLWPGTYDVSFVANQKLCGPGVAAPAMPCLGGELRSGLALQSNGVLDLDVRAISISGAVKLDGQALPEAEKDRGALAFAQIDGAKAALSIGLGTNQTPGYAVTVVPGKYVVSHTANPALCGGASAPTIPCASQTIAGCS
jgi:hypothetical protein